MRFENEKDRKARIRRSKARRAKRYGQNAAESTLAEQADSGSVQSVSLSIGQLRENLRKAAEASGLSYAEIGVRMGQPDIETAKNKVNYLLNRASDPGILTILSFCDAVGKDVQSLLAGR